MSKTSILLFFILILLLLLLSLWYSARGEPSSDRPTRNIPSAISVPIPTPTTVLFTPLGRKILPNTYHIFQTFNNCGPAALSMALSYYGINVTQQILGQELRPYQNSSGDNDDKSVTLDELAKKAGEYNLIPYHRPNGSIELVRYFISYDIPVITRTLLKENEDIGHYRVIKGYDDEQESLIQDDSLQGKNLWYSYENFNMLWKQFNYEYLVLVPPDKKIIAEAILNNDSDSKSAWKKAANLSHSQLTITPSDVFARFNLSVAYHNIGEYEKSIEEFEKVESQLPFRTLWYQIEPIQAYYQLGNYDRVFSLTDKVLNNYNRAFSELYILRGRTYQKQGNIDKAREEFEKAVFYNSNLEEARQALNSLKPI